MQYSQWWGFFELSSKVIRNISEFFFGYLVYLWVSECEVFGLKNCWFHNDVLGAQCACGSISPGGNGHWIDEANAQTRQNYQKHCEFHFTV